jgi:hypothetical protein
MILEFAFMPPQGIGLTVAAAGRVPMMGWYFLVGPTASALSR